MSLILNALKKSEQERLASQSSKLEYKLLDIPVGVENKKTPIWVWALIIVNCFILLFFIKFYFLDQKTELVNKGVSVPALKVTTKEPIPIESGIASKIEGSSLSQLVRTKKKNELIEKQRADAQQAENKRLEQQKKVATEAVVLPKKAVELATKSRVVKQIKPILSEPKKARILDDKKEEGPPFLLSLSRDFRRSVPRLNINVFYYSSVESERFIMVDMRKYQSDQEIVEGMVLKEIRKNSIVVEFDNRVFQIKR